MRCKTSSTHVFSHFAVFLLFSGENSQNYNSIKLFSFTNFFLCTYNCRQYIFEANVSSGLFYRKLGCHNGNRYSNVFELILYVHEHIRRLLNYSNTLILANQYLFLFCILIGSMLSSQMLSILAIRSIFIHARFHRISTYIFTVVTDNADTNESKIKNSVEAILSRRESLKGKSLDKLLLS